LINQNRWSNGWPFVVISPQHAGGGCPSSAEIEAMISYCVTHYTLDTRRLYLTGLSCGAIGSWSYVGQHLDQQIAAAVLIAGDPGPVNVNYSAWGRNMCTLGKVPIWSFHGDMDGTVLPGNDRDTMNLLMACPAPPRLDAQYTEYPGVGHDSWTRTYDLSAGHDIYTWLLQQSKP
jgi:predicted peptidase